MKISKKTISFKAAVRDTPDIRHNCKAGLQGLGKYSSKVELGDTRACEGSVDIDSSTASVYPNESRWDYCFSYKGSVYFIEVHPAQTSQISTVLNKLKWLKEWLAQKAPKINELKAKGEPYYWIQSNGFHIPKTSAQYRAAIEKGIKPIGKLSLN